jgi:hypothetical protein
VHWWSAFEGYQQVDHHLDAMGNPSSSWAKARQLGGCQAACGAQLHGLVKKFHVSNAGSGDGLHVHGPGSVRHLVIIKPEVTASTTCTPISPTLPIIGRWEHGSLDPATTLGTLACPRGLCDLTSSLGSCNSIRSTPPPFFNWVCFFFFFFFFLLQQSFDLN